MVIYPPTLPQRIKLRCDQIFIIVMRSALHYIVHVCVNYLTSHIFNPCIWCFFCRLVLVVSFIRRAEIVPPYCLNFSLLLYLQFVLCIGQKVLFSRNFPETEMKWFTLKLLLSLSSYCASCGKLCFYQTVSSNCWLFSTVSLLPCDRIKSNLQISPNQAVLYSVYGQSAAPHKNKVKRRPRNLEVGLHNRQKSKTVYYKQYDCKVK